MQATRLLDEIRQLPAKDRLELLNKLWAELGESDSVAPLTPAQRQVLDERIKEHEDNPDQVVPWEQARDQILDQL
ncbi:MAG: addiction module protein [Phycisphaeraceae bacterium]